MKAFFHRYWLPVVFAVCGAALALGGVGTATVWRPASSLTAQYELDSSPALVLGQPGLLSLYADEVKVSLASKSACQFALARGGDGQAWAQGANYTLLTGVDSRGDFTTKKHQASQDQGTQELNLANPGGQDMWLLYKESEQGKLVLDYRVERLDVVPLIWCEKGPSQLSFTWQREVSNPWVVPLLAIGLLLLFLALVSGFFLQRMAHAVDREVAKAKAQRKRLNDVLDPSTGSLPSLKSVSRPPSRREMRQARDLGIEEIEVEGVNFPTGHIPKIMVDSDGKPIPPSVSAASDRAATAASEASSASAKQLPLPPQSARGVGKWASQRGFASAPDVNELGPNLEIWEEEKNA